MEANTQQQESLGLKPGSRGNGRKSGDGTEEPLKIKPIKDDIGDLMKLYRKEIDAKEKTNEKAKSIAERSNCSAGTLKRLVRASYRGKFEETQRKINQESDVFEAIGEVPGGKGAD